MSLVILPIWMKQAISGSMLIVVGGLLAGLLVSFPLKDMKHMFTVIRHGFSHNEQNLSGLIKTFVHLSDRARREGLLSLETQLDGIDDPFIRKGILLAVDGIEPDAFDETEEKVRQ